MTFKEFQEKYKDVRIEEFFPHCNPRYDACIGDDYNIMFGYFVLWLVMYGFVLKQLL